MSDSLDTCVVLAAIIGKPIDQRDATWELLENEKMAHHVADLAISEAVHVLESHYGEPRDKIVYELEKFFTTHDDVLDYNRQLIEFVLPFYETHPALSFNDCYLAFDAEVRHVEPLFTFDAKLARQHPSAKMLE